MGPRVGCKLSDRAWRFHQDYDPGRIELALNPRSYVFADDSDFFNLEFDKPIKITVTMAGLSSEFRSDDRYGMCLRGWDAQENMIQDEPGKGLEDSLSIRVMIDQSLEARWSIFNDRIDKEESGGAALAAHSS